MVNIYKTIHKGWEGQVSVDYFCFFIDSFSDLPTDATAFSTETDKYKIATGSVAIDVNSCKIYVFTSSETWNEWSSGGGSGTSEGITVKQGEIDYTVATANDGSCALTESDLPSDYLGLFTIRKIYRNTPVTADIAYSNPSFPWGSAYKIGFGISYISTGHYTYDPAYNVPAGTKIKIIFEYIAKTS